MMWIIALIRSLILAGLVLQINGKVKVSFRLISFENTRHIELDGGCCDQFFGCGSCDNRFNLCFDVYQGNNDMTDCAYDNLQTDRLYENNDDFNFPSTLSSSEVNPIILTINSWSNGFRSKIEVWDYDPPPNGDDKIDYYGYNYNFSPDRTSALATEHTVTLNGAGTSLMTVGVKVYCDLHYYGTSSGCNTYCLARDNSQGHYDCDDITGARVCDPGWTGSYCNVEINECDSDPCQFNAACTDLLADYRCNCPAGTQGKNCDDINECSSDPCEHGGTCENKLNHYQCHCPREYSGVNCQFEIDFCESNPCQNGGTCLGENDIDVLECVCVPGYRGIFCDEDIDECFGVDCNNGTCQDGVNQFTCNCTEGYSGTYCDLDIRDECASSPCQNNASCIDKVDGYVCICQAGFQNDNCEQDINECDPNPCSNGNCTDEVGRHTCDCWPGFSGENCTVDINECLENLCQHNSTCEDGVNNYTCSCRPGYTGIYCDMEIDECSSLPCQNSGRCEDSLNNFTCQCTSTGYQGRLCEIDIDECLNEGACPSNKICVNVNGSYDCDERPVEPTHFPGLCSTSSCYNGGICMIINDSYQCVCTDDFSGELCQTPIEPCAPNPCLNDGSCQVQTAENGSVYYNCQCQQDYSGINCELLVGRQTGGPEGGFTYWYLVLIATLFIMLILGAGICFYKVHRDRRDKFVDDIPTVFANPHTDSISIPTTLGAIAGPPLPPKGKLEDPDMSVTFTNNLYSDIDGPEVRGAFGVSPNPKDDIDKEDPYAIGGYIHMNGHAQVGQHENPYEFARDLDVTDPRPVKENDYSTDPTSVKSEQKPFNLDSSYSTTIFPDKEPPRPISTSIPPPLPQRDNSMRAVPSEYDVPIQQRDNPTRVVPSEYDVPRTMPSNVSPGPTDVEPPYSFNIYKQDEDSSTPNEASLPSNPDNPSSTEASSHHEVEEQPPTPTSGPPTPSSPNYPHSTTTSEGNNQSNV